MCLIVLSCNAMIRVLISHNESHHEWSNEGARARLAAGAATARCGRRWIRYPLWLH